MSGKTVLFVEDNAVIALSTVSVLEKHRFSCRWVESGEKALEIIKEDPRIDIALVNIELGIGMDGIETAKKILGVRDLPLVFFTGFMDSETLEMIKNISRYGFVEKNANEYVLVETLNIACRLFESRQATCENGEELSAIYEHTPVIIALLDAERKIRKVNSFASSFTDLPPAKLEGLRIGRALCCIHHVDDPRGCGYGPFCARCELRMTVRSTFDTGREYYRNEVKVYTTVSGPEENRELTFSVSTALLHHTDPPRVLVSLEDVTERKQKEEALRTSELKFRTIFNSVNDAIYLHTVGGDGGPGNFFEVNSAACRMLGYSREELIQMSPFDIDDPGFEANRDQVKKDLRDRGYSTFEMVQITKKGEKIPVEISARMFELHGEQCIISVARDLTEQKLALQKITKELKEKNVLLREIHHRVKNNLSVVISLLSLQLDQIDTRERAEELLLASRERIYSMALVHEKLYQSSNLAEIEMEHYIDSLIQELYSVYGRDEITVNIRADGICLDIVSAIPCGLILNELITNSMLHAFPENGGGNIDVLIERNGEGKVKLTVQDDGDGLPGSFESAGSATFGLNLVKLLTEQLRGELEFANTEGTSFRISFPYGG